MKSYSRATDPRMIAAQHSEIRDLIRRGKFKVILKEEIPEGANFLTVRFLLSLKSAVDAGIKFKAIYLAGGNRVF